ncbi:MAG: hypothetical protein HYZ36_06705 [Pedosphaera parvula]|nr:hypothetical protein [Pedosphaera parvula]
MDANAIGELGGQEKGRGRAMHQIAAVDRQAWVTAREVNACSRTLEAQRIVQGHGMHDGFQLVKAIRAFAKDVEQQIDLAGG